MNTNTQNEIQIGADKVMDVRAIPCSVKHGFIISTAQGLAVGDHFILRNDHDPVRLRDQFSTQWPGSFAWEYVVNEPDDFRVKITKLKETRPATVSAPGCGCEH